MERESDYRQILTDKIIEQLEKGTAPWAKPWDPRQGSYELPQNPVTGKAYHGANSLLLAAVASEKGYDDSRWCTYKQAAEKGWQVKKGEKGTMVEYWKFTDQRDVLDAKGKPVLDAKGERIKEEVRLEKPQVFRAFVFNAAQMDGVPPPVKEPKQYEWNPADKAESILQKSGAKISHDQSDRAFYSPMTDEIRLPKKENFRDAAGYYGTALHELSHWTGHQSRLNRELLKGGGFGSPDYAKEELRAELASYFISDRLGVPHNPEQHAAYVGHWIKALREDKNEIFKAARDAEKITEYVLAFDRTKEKELAKDKEKGAEKTPPPSSLESNQTRTYLAVAYQDRMAAKSAGAMWDKELKSWYAPPGTDLEPLKRWLPERSREVPRDPKAEFTQALRAAGLLVEGEAIMDGQMHRVPVVGGKQGTRDGAYVGHLDGRPAGFIQNFRTGEKTNWKMDGDFDADKKAALAAEAAQTLERRREETIKRQLEVAEKCAARWNMMVECPDGGTHEYLKRKQVPAVGVKFDGDKMVVPLRDVDGKIWSMQSISSSAQVEKMLEKDGRKVGNMHIMGKITPGEALIVAEGYATAASIHAATGRPVVVAFDAGNLGPVMHALKGKYPTSQLVVAADNDPLKEVGIGQNKRLANVGAEKALEAAQLHGAKLILPQFSKDRTRESDFNDLQARAGSSEVKRQIEAGLKLSVEQSRTETLKHLKQQSLDEIQRMVEKMGLKVGREPGQMTQHTGRVIAVTAHHLVQENGRSATVHELQKLQQRPEIGKTVSIQYQQGQGKVVEKKIERSMGRSLELSR